MELNEFTTDQLLNIQDHAPKTIVLTMNEEEVSLADVMLEDLKMENELNVLPHLIKGHEDLLEDVTALIKSITMEYTDADGEKEEQLSEILSVVLNYQKELKEEIIYLEERLKDAKEREELSKAHEEAMAVVRKLEEELKDLQAELKEHQKTADDLRVQLMRKRAGRNVRRKNNRNAHREDPEFATWVDKTKNRTRSFTSKALGSSINFLKDLQKKLPEDEAKEDKS